METKYYELLGRMMEVHIKDTQEGCNRLITDFIEKCAKIAYEAVLEASGERETREQVPLGCCPAIVEEPEPEPEQKVAEPASDPTPKMEVKEIISMVGLEPNEYLANYEPVLTRHIIINGVDTGRLEHSATCHCFNEKGNPFKITVYSEDPEKLKRALEIRKKHDAKMVAKFQYEEEIDTSTIIKPISAGKFFPEREKPQEIKLSPREKELYLLMREEPDKTVEDYAEIMGVQRQSIYAMQHSIRKKLSLNKGAIDNGK